MTRGHPFDPGDPVGREGHPGVGQEPGAGRVLLVGADLDVGQAGAVVDRGVHGVVPVLTVARGGVPDPTPAHGLAASVRVDLPRLGIRPSLVTSTWINDLGCGCSCGSPLGVGRA